MGGDFFQKKPLKDFTEDIEETDRSKVVGNVFGFVGNCYFNRFSRCFSLTGNEEKL